MKKLRFLACAVASFLGLTAGAQTQITAEELNALNRTVSDSWVSIHDPSVVFDKTTKTFYIVGSHRGVASSTDLINWKDLYWTNNPIADYKNDFKSCPTHTVKRVLPGKTEAEEVTLGSFDAGAFCATYAGITVGDRKPTTEADWISGDMWAPDIIYNSNMGKWCYYLSLNGDNWASVIILMTADKPTGPFKYEAPIVFGGFNGQSYSGKSVNYKNTDLEVVLGTQSSLPSRYKTNSWGSFYPNCIDPCVFFDEEGELWMSYGSWSGGIYILKLDKETGLRDYTHTYTGTGTSPSGSATSDAYFGKKIAGGWYVSGEGSYIQHIGNYYYLFVSYGFFSPDGGYEMRIFRSEKPDGPYKDNSYNALFTDRYYMNYGPNTTCENRGQRIIGSYNGWNGMTVGECAQGHNSACADDQGRNFLVFHTKFNDGTAGHKVRTHQMFLNEKQWLVASPFRFAGDTITDAGIASKQFYATDEIVGTYQVVQHPYKMNYSKMQESTPKEIVLTADGKVSGDYAGTWSVKEGTSYFTIRAASVTYYGVIIPQTPFGTGYKSVAFTATSLTGVPLWGYKLDDKSALAFNFAKANIPVKSGSSYNKNIDNLWFDTSLGVTLDWTSSDEDVISSTGKYTPQDAATPVTLKMHLGNDAYFYEQAYDITAGKASTIYSKYYTMDGMAAYYGFNDGNLKNAWNADDEAVLARASTKGTVPTVSEQDKNRIGGALHLAFGAQADCSYARMPNPLYGKTLDGFTVSMWIKRGDLNNWDALWSFFSGDKSSAAGPRLYMTGNSYFGFNDNAGNWFDVNHPSTKGDLQNIPVGKWALVTMVFSKEDGHTLYINGSRVFDSCYNDNNGKTSASGSGFDYSLVTKFVSEATHFNLGYGSFWGSALADIDDVIIYGRALSSNEVKGLNAVENWNKDFDLEIQQALDVDCIEAEAEDAPLIRDYMEGVTDLLGRPVTTLQRGTIYVVDGKLVRY